LTAFFSEVGSGDLGVYITFAGSSSFLMHEKIKKTLPNKQTFSRLCDLQTNGNANTE
jgi:hypothetical protein